MREQWTETHAAIVNSAAKVSRTELDTYRSDNKTDELTGQDKL